jgi:hypothetical protein
MPRNQTRRALAMRSRLRERSFYIEENICVSVSPPITVGFG